MSLTVGYVSSAELAYETEPLQNRKAVKKPTGSNISRNNACDTFETKSVKFDEHGYPVPDGKSLTFKEGFLFFSNDEYTYTANGKESIGDIKAKFHLKDKAINKCQPYIRDDGYVPEKGIKISFYKEDVIAK